MGFKLSLEEVSHGRVANSDEESRNSIADIRNMTVNPGAAYAIPLSAVAKVEESIGPSEITRVDQQRVAIISADIQKGDLGEAVVEAQALLNQLKQLPNTSKASTKNSMIGRWLLQLIIVDLEM